MHSAPVGKIVAAWLIGLVLVGAAFVVTVTLLNGRLYSPERQVGLYFDALEEGDGGAALGLLNASLPDGANPALLDGEALRQGTASLTGVDVADARTAGENRVEVPVTYTLDGAELTTVFPLQRTGTEWLFFDVWEFEPTVLPAVEVSALNSVEATVNGVDVGLPSGSARVAAFYPTTVGAGFGGQYFAAPERRVTVSSADAPLPPLDLVTEPTAELTQAVDQQIHTYLDDCAGQIVFQPTNCPFNYETDERLAGEITWSIEQYPSVSITARDGGWSVAPLRGSARIDTRLRDLFSGAVREVSEPVPFEFDADLTVTEDAITVSPVVRY